MNPIPSINPVASPVVNNDPRAQYQYGGANNTSSTAVAGQQTYSQTPTYNGGGNFNYGGGTDNYYPTGAAVNTAYSPAVGPQFSPPVSTMLPGVTPGVNGLNAPGLAPTWARPGTDNTMGAMNGYGWNGGYSNPLAVSPHMKSNNDMPTPEMVMGTTANRLQTTGMPAVVGPAAAGGVVGNAAPLSADVGNQLNLMA